MFPTSRSQLTPPFAPMTDAGQSVVASVSRLIWASPDRNEFPVIVQIDTADADVALLEAHLSAHEITWRHSESNIHALPTQRLLATDLIDFLDSKSVAYTMDYSRFIVHPATVKITGLREVTSDDLKKTLKASTPHGSILEVKSGPPDSALVTFANFVDADFMLLPDFSLPQQEDANVSRISHPQVSPRILLSPSDAVVYDSIVVENLDTVLGPLASVELVADVVSKFALFGEVDAVFCPFLALSSQDLRLAWATFVGFSPSQSTSTDVLRCLYFLNNLSLAELQAFSGHDIYDLQKDLGRPDMPPVADMAPRLKLSIAQRKHNHYLYDHNECSFVGLDSSKKFIMSRALSSDQFEAKIVRRFLRLSNYQETNVYVNHFPILFENNDKLWQEFWDQFGIGGIKSAKIIKPQFYSKKPDDALGKIGFVFYQDIKMALRAIILTNNRTATHGGTLVPIQASFALQKSSLSLLNQKPPKMMHANSGAPANGPPYYGHDGGPKRKTSLPPGDFRLYAQDDATLASPPPYMMSGDLHFVFNPYFVPMPTFSPPGGAPDGNRISLPHAANQDAGGHPSSYPGYFYPYYPFPVPPMPIVVAPPFSPDQQNPSSE